MDLDLWDYKMALDLWDCFASRITILNFLLPKQSHRSRSIFQDGSRSLGFWKGKNPVLYRIFLAIRRGFRPSRMTSNNLISPMKFCYNTNSTLPKQCQSSRSILQDGSRTFGLFWKEKKPVL